MVTVHYQLNIQLTHNAYFRLAKETFLLVTFTKIFSFSNDIKITQKVQKV
jgi:hypothetical protein